MDKVSIIMPAYNTEKQIEKSIKSVLGQTYHHLELIIINDGSTDRTEKIIFDFKENDSRIKYFKIENSGSAVARNIGLDNATGTYISFVDSDDYIEENMIEVLLRKAKEYDADIVSCSYKTKISNKFIEKKTYLKEGYYTKSRLEKEFYPSIISNTSLKKNVLPVAMWTKIYTKELIEKSNIRFIPKLKMGQDMDFIVKCMLYADSFYYLPTHKLYNYVDNKFSRTNTYLENAWEILKERNNQYKSLGQEFPQYNLEKQLSHDLVAKSMTAIANFARYDKDISKNEKLSKLNEVIYDQELQNALNEVSFQHYSRVRKLLATLMKNKQTILIYYLIKFYKNM